MSRACDVSFQKCNHPNHVCQFIEKEDIIKLTNIMFDKGNNHYETSKHKDLNKYTMKALYKLSSSRVDNAFNIVDFGGDRFGIYGCSPSYMVHAFLEGVLKLCVSIFLDPLSP
jgi:hypothetical protein